ncbi:FAD-binding oxidoreductase [Verminephrobacter aporrectodeae subsp. tuberculatae]|uniref:NAD(P)/FAD-dependent oxidoreductase n=1 Tax=Verminephrobacter aporrectodeae TaxID=1110389 RepID=UPI00223870EA|nr:FAD-dependent oxidoreductase [Verminephrobacter aporrectodeae]MCW5221063.1 FAD-binding oxidoreductase [Verminephrobacter aporrectodeae subsp. tuberculatae]MCW5290356.1 FAD-binding oxidoreductase [Verminephrobacter aporrectodeae subsp. tuberculatae]
MYSKATCELAVIGGGVIGAVTAYLARATGDYNSVALVDRAGLGSGATRYSAGVALPYGASALVRGASVQAMSSYAGRLSALVAPAATITPFFVVLPPASAAPPWNAFHGGAAREIPRVDVKALQARLPMLQLKTWDLFEYGYCVRYDAQRLMDELKHALRLMGGVQIREGCEVRAIHCDGKCLELEGIATSTVSAGRVCVATGPWMPSRLPECTGLRTKRVVALKLAGCRALPGTIFAPTLDVFVAPNPGGETAILSYRSEKWDVEPGSQQACVSDEDVAHAMRATEGLLCDIDVRVIGGQAFVDAYRTPADPCAFRGRERGLVFAGACGGSGIRLAPSIAQQALRLLCEPPLGDELTATEPSWRVEHEVKILSC